MRRADGRYEFEAGVLEADLAALAERQGEHLARGDGGRSEGTVLLGMDNTRLDARPRSAAARRAIAGSRRCGRGTRGHTERERG